MKAVNIAAVKMCGVAAPFSLMCDDSEERWVANMHHQNFTRLRNGGLRFPIAVELTPRGLINISDTRIKPKWLHANFQK